MEAVPPSGCSKQGWLVKKGKSSTRLWFELWGDSLIYYTSRLPPQRRCAQCTLLGISNTYEDVGSITLSENATIQDPRILTGRGWIEISKRYTSYFLRAADEKDTTAWTDALEQAVKKRQVESRLMAHAVRVIFLLALDRSLLASSRLALIPLDLLAIMLNRLLPLRCVLPMGIRRNELSHVVNVVVALRDSLRQGTALRLPKLGVPDQIRPVDAHRLATNSPDTVASSQVAEGVP